MLKAAVEIKGKQFLVAEKQKLTVPKLNEKDGAKVIFDQVLAIIDGAKTKVGKPTVAKAKVEAKVVKNQKGKKILVEKFHLKKRYHRTRGHRQPETVIEVSKIVC